MKRSTVLALVMALAAVTMFAQPAKKGVTVSYPQFELSSYAQPNAAGPFLVGRFEKGKKEQFGIVFAGAQGSMSVIEFLDAAGKVLKSITVNDLLGKATNNGVRVLRSRANETATRAEAAYEVTLPQGKSELLIRSVATGVSPGAKARLLLSFVLKNAVPDIGSVRLSLPTDGQVEVQEGGFVLSAKTQPGALSSAVFPKAQSVTVAKNVITVNGGKVSAPANQSEMPLLWMVVEGSESANAATAKSEAGSALKKNANFVVDPNLVIITTANKQSTQPTDTVTYTLICVNTGLGNATEVVLTNPIPVGTRYVENSATGEKTEITVSRTTTAAPQLGEAKEVKWKLLEALSPGSEHTVTFKVVIL
jgi:uncharacterized repeat protein (TIGR01451 family)